MKKLIINLVLPLTIISFGITTKWWETLQREAPETIFYGFPLPFLSSSANTSMSLQFFVAEFFIDFLCYLLIWYIVIFGFNRFWKKPKANTFLPIGLWLASGIIMFLALLVGRSPDNIYHSHRKFKIEVVETGLNFFGKKRL